MQQRLRTGSELMNATAPFSKEDPATTWRLWITTLAVWFAFAAYTVLLPFTAPAWVPAAWATSFVALMWMGKALGTLFLGLTFVRIFIFFHDYEHGAIFRKSKLGKAMMTLVGWWTMAVPSVWKETHDYHHRNNMKLMGSSIGSYPLVSIGVYKALKPEQRRNYKLVRSPWNIALGFFTVFMLGMSVAPFRRDPKAHWAAPWAVVAYWGVFAVFGLTVGWVNALFVWALPNVLSHAAGSYLFYVQHNFPDAKPQGRREWDFTHAALHCSSMFDMTPMMHWFTGNIGYHHAHHLNHKIPFYRLPEAMAAIPELQNPGRTSWALADIKAALDVGCWDPEAQRFLSLREADARLAETAQAVAAK